MKNKIEAENVTNEAKIINIKQENIIAIQPVAPIRGQKLATNDILNSTQAFYKITHKPRRIVLGFIFSERKLVRGFDERK